MSEPATEPMHYRDRPWWHPSHLFAKALGVVVAAVLSQIVVPGIIPTLQLWLYEWTTFDFSEPRYVLVASHQDLAGDPAKADIEFNRVFCGFTLPTAKSCLMHRVMPDDMRPPNKWLFDKSPIKAVLLGARSPLAFVAWISERSGAGGSAVGPDFGNGVFVGYGIACTKLAPNDEGRPYPVKTIYGNLPAEIDADTPTPIDKVRAAAATLMNQTKISVELREQPSKVAAAQLPGLLDKATACAPTTHKQAR